MAHTSSRRENINRAVNTVDLQHDIKSIHECEEALSALGLSDQEIRSIRDTITVMIEQYLDVFTA